MIRINFLTLRYFSFIFLVSISTYGQLIDMDYTRADSVAALYAGHSLEDTRLLAWKLTNGLESEQEKFRSIFKWVCDNIENDPVAFEIHTFKRKKFANKPEKLEEWNRQFSHKVFETLKKEHKTVCTGYASLIKELTYHIGLNCEIVNGYGRTAHSKMKGEKVPNHSWNAVQIDGKWFLSDATWSAGAIHPHLNKFIHDFNEAYFLSDPKVFALNHYPLDTSKLFLNDKPTFEKFILAPLVYNEALAKEIIPVSPDIFKIEVQKGKTISFQYRSENLISPDKFTIQLVIGNNRQNLPINIKYDEEGMYSVNYQFKQKGLFVWHILLNNKYIISYEVKVNKPQS